MNFNKGWKNQTKNAPIIVNFALILLNVGKKQTKNVQICLFDILNLSRVSPTRSFACTGGRLMDLWAVNKGDLPYKGRGRKLKFIFALKPSLVEKIFTKTIFYALLIFSHFFVPLLR
jgi:hypothetical protein